MSYSNSNASASTSTRGAAPVPLPLQPSSSSNGATRPPNARRPSFGAEKAARMTLQPQQTATSPPRTSSRLRHKFSTEAMRSGQAPSISVPMPMPHHLASSIAPPLPSPVGSLRSVSSDYKPAGPSGTTTGSGAAEKSGWYRSKSSKNLAALAAAHAANPPDSTSSSRERQKHGGKDDDDEFDDGASVSSFTCSSAREFDRQVRRFDALPVSMAVLAQTSTPEEAAAKAREHKQHWLDGMFGKLASKGLKKKKSEADALAAGKNGAAAADRHFLDLSTVISPLPGAMPLPPAESPPRPKLDRQAFSASAVPTVKGLATPGRPPRRGAGLRADADEPQARSHSSLSFRSFDEASSLSPPSSLATLAEDRPLMHQRSVDRLRAEDVSAPAAAARILQGHGRQRSGSVAAPSSGAAMLRSQTESAPRLPSSNRAGAQMGRTNSDSVRTTSQMQAAAQGRPILPTRASSTSHAALGAATNMALSLSSSSSSSSSSHARRSDLDSRGSVSSISTDSTGGPHTPSSATPLGRILYGAGEGESPFPPMPLQHGGSYTPPPPAPHGLAGAAGIGAHHAGSALMLSGMDVQAWDGDERHALSSTPDEPRSKSPLMASRALAEINTTPRPGRTFEESPSCADDGDVTLVRSANRTPGRRPRAHTLASRAAPPNLAFASSFNMPLAARADDRASISSRSSAASSIDDRHSRGSDAFAYADRLSQASVLSGMSAMSGTFLRKERLAATVEEPRQSSTAF